MVGIELVRPKKYLKRKEGSTESLTGVVCGLNHLINVDGNIHSSAVAEFNYFEMLFEYSIIVDADARC